jgi:hypothetical protein
MADGWLMEADGWPMGALWVPNGRKINDRTHRAPIGHHRALIG